MKLTAAEKETIILTSEAVDTASVYTYNRKLIKKLKRLSMKFPDKFYLEKQDSHGGMYFVVPKKCVQVREPYSEKRREVAREHAIKGGYKPSKQE